MTLAHIEAGTLTASRASRIVSGLLLPFGEVGRTNLGKFSVEPETIEIPEDLDGVVFNDEHRREDPIGSLITATETDAGIVATFSVAKTPAGDAALADIEAGRRTSLSAEVAGIVIRGGKAVGGKLFGAALVAQGAFPSATLLAADVGDPKDDPEDDLDDPKDPEDPEDPTEKDKPVTNLTAGAPAGLRRARPKAGIASAGDLFAKIAGANQAMSPSTMLAALDQIIATDVAAAQQPQYLDEIWGSRTYNRRYTGLISNSPLTSLKAIGWRFVEGKTPTVGDYAGFPAQPVSTEVKTEPVEITASRIAGGGEFDRAFTDFSVPGFWEGYYREAANDYARKSDVKVPAALVAGATSVVADAVPAGIATAASYIIDGAVQIIDAEIGLPSFAIVGTGLYKQLLKTRTDDMLAYLNLALGLEDGTIETFQIKPSSLPAYAGKVLVGAKDAATWFELSGSPVRVDTVNIANGGGQTGLFGYWATLINQPKGIALVGPAAG